MKEDGVQVAWSGHCCELMGWFGNGLGIRSLAQIHQQMDSMPQIPIAPSEQQRRGKECGVLEKETFQKKETKRRNGMKASDIRTQTENERRENEAEAHLGSDRLPLLFTTARLNISSTNTILIVLRIARVLIRR